MVDINSQLKVASKNGRSKFFNDGDSLKRAIEEEEIGRCFVFIIASVSNIIFIYLCQKISKLSNVIKKFELSFFFYKLFHKAVVPRNVGLFYAILSRELSYAFLS